MVLRSASPFLLATVFLFATALACSSSPTSPSASADDAGSAPANEGGALSSGSGGSGAGGASSGGGGSGNAGNGGSSGAGPSGGSTPGQEGDAGVSNGPLPAWDGGTYDGSSTPDFGPNVLVFDPSMNDIQSTIDGVFGAQQSNQFGTQRYAYLFKPGSYSLDVQLGFYMHVIGLGATPDDVSITGAVRSMAAWNQGNATENFWRGVDNLKIVLSPSVTSQNFWAVSQGTWLRRVHVAGGIELFDYTENGPNNWASGGFIADSKVDGQVVPGSQQQFLTRNVEMGSWSGGVWNMVFVGDEGDPAGTWPAQPFTFVASTPTIREKPFLTIDSQGSYSVVVPTLGAGTVGTTWANGAPASTTLPIRSFYVARASTDTAQSINAALAQGANLILTPGVYPLDTPINVTRPGTVVLGLGLPTLVPTGGTASMLVADVDGVSISGIIFDAGPVMSNVLLQVGPSKSTVNHAADPTVLYDLSCRVGGATVGTTDTCTLVNSNDVIVDNLWQWRADHGAGAAWATNVANHGIVVNGDRVSAYGLFVEHFEQYQTVWNGDGGRDYFYQSEIPYDVPSQGAWAPPGGQNGYSSFYLADGVTSFDGQGLGVYCYFDNNVALDNAVVGPPASGVALHHIVTQWFKNAPDSAINHIINGTGAAVNAANTGATTPD